MIQERMSLTNLFRSAIVFSLAMLAGACSRSEKEVSGPSFCRDFTEENLAKLSRQGDLPSARSLRDLYMGCDLTGKYTDESLLWAKTSAELGDSEDRRVYDGLLSATKVPAAKP